jgi:hypothetical protein
LYIRLTFTKNPYRFCCKNCISKNIILDDVYYIHKCWFDKDRNPLFIKEINEDFEYNEYIYSWENKITDIKEMNVYQDIKEEVMYLDYIYGFYNFGEFWDVIKRLLVTKKRNLPLFHLTHNRINNINYYFDKLNFKFPTGYQKTERSFKLYHFDKINITTITNGGCICYIDKNLGYNFNKLFNPCEIIDKSYNIYLARGPNGRSIIDENKIIDILKNKYNFIVLNGSESLQDTIHYFTNAKIYGVDILSSDRVMDELFNDSRVILHTSSDGYNEEFFKTKFLNKNIKFDFMLDDGPHTLESMKTFIRLYSQIIADNGILIIEDVQSIEIIENLINEVPLHLKPYIEIYDLRHIKNRYDDIVFVINRNK